MIAGPGAGKTMAIVERVVKLIGEGGVAPENIMISTFTEKAAKELVTRISNRINDLGIKVSLNEMYIGTLHSIFLKILKDYTEFTRLKKNYKTYDDFDQNYAVYTQRAMSPAGEHWRHRCFGLTTGQIAPAPRAAFSTSAELSSLAPTASAFS